MDLPDDLDRTLRLGACVVDFAAYVARWPGEDRSLTPTETRLLGYLASQDGRAVDARELLKEVWGYRGGVVSGTVKTTIGRLRGKIEADPRSPAHVLTAPGVGYRFRGLESDAAVPPPPAPPQVVRSPGSLPPAPPLIGRSGALERARGLIEGARWLTLTGPAGVGKSALAVALGHDGHDTLGAAWLVGLESAATEADVVAAVAHTLGIDQAGEGASALLAPLRARGPGLLILDDVDACEASVVDVITAWWPAEELRFLVTSRAPLRSPSERTLAVEPLPPPAAAALFLARAVARLPGYDDADRLASVLEPLDGLPLALEMAAGWAGFLDPGSLRQQLDRQLELLRSEGREAGRHRSLAATFRSSWDLLDEVHREALAQSTVFAGAFDLDAADAVLRLPGGQPAMPAVRDLVRRGLALRVAPPGGRGATQVRLLRAVGELAAARGERPEARDRHAAWFASYGDPDALTALLAVGGAGPLARLQQASPDLARAWEWSGSQGDLRAAARSARALVVLARLLGPVGAWSARARSLADDPALPASERANLLLELAHEPLAGGDTSHLAGLLDVIAALPDGDEARAADVAWLRAAAALRAGAEDALAASEAAVEVARPTGAGAVGRALVTFATAARTFGDNARARRLAREALERLRVAGDLRQEQRAWEVLGNLDLDAGQLDDGRRHFGEALRRAEQRGDRPAIGYLLGRLGSLEALAGDHDSSAGRFGEALAVLRQVGDRAREGYTLANHGAMELDRDRYLSGRDSLEEALGIGLELGDRRLEAAARANLAELCLWLGREDQARRHVERGRELARELRFRRLELGIEGVAVELTYGEGRLEDARASAARVADGLQEVGAGLDAARYLESFAARELDAGHPDEAAAMLARADRLRDG